jgi:hypothetical protein
MAEGNETCAADKLGQTQCQPVDRKVAKTATAPRDARQSVRLKRFASGWCRYRARARARARRRVRSASGLAAITQRNRATATPTHTGRKMTAKVAADTGSLLEPVYMT